jgi:recombination protein RecT
MGQRAPQFMASIVSLVSSDTKFNDVEPNTIIASAIIAVTLDLPINPQLGYAHIIPYGGKATFQMGWRAYKQLAIRTGLYRFINSTDVREGELKSRNRLTGEVILDFVEDTEERDKLPVVGYVNFFELTTGYRSALYMSMNELLAHAKKYSKLYQVDLRKKSQLSKWSIAEELPFMCLKTVTKLNLSNNGILSVEMQKAKIADDAVVDEGGNPTEYPDNPSGEVDASYEEDNEEQQINWESHISVLAAIENIKDADKCLAFEKNNQARIGQIGGKEGETIEAAMTAKKKELKIK